MEQPVYHLEGVVRSRAESLEDFNGPLDVIFLLLSKNKIEIQDVSISAILEQYLAYLDEMKRMDVEIASEFTAMASHLMLIKTKMLLSAAEAAEAQDEMELLIQSLEQRRQREAFSRLRDGVCFLAERNALGLGLFTKQPEPISRDQTYRYQHTPDDLLAALAGIEEREARMLPPPASNFAGIVGSEPYPVTVKAAEILRRLLSSGVSRFLALFRRSRSRSEIVATFLAVLELCKLKSISVEEQDGETTVTYLQMPEETTAGERSARDGTE